MLVKEFKQVILRLWRAFRKRRAIRSYLGRLGPQLRKRYGPSKYYSIGQVYRTVFEADFDPTYFPYALSIFGSRREFNSHEASRGHDYDALRREVADHFFHGDTSVGAHSSSANAHFDESHGHSDLEHGGHADHGHGGDGYWGDGP